MSQATNDLFDLINNAIFDLQAADLQSYGLHLKTLGRLLRDSKLTSINQELIKGLNLAKFLDEGAATQGSMVGSASLDWPDDDRGILGLRLLLVLKFSDEPGYMAEFGHTFYYTGSKIIQDVRAVISQVIVPFARDYKAYVLGQGRVTPPVISPKSNRVFIVHGHDETTKLAVARFVERLGLEAIILHDRPNKGRTIITKFQEEAANVGFAVVLMTPDDQGSKSGEAMVSRARQNVVFELGFFIGILGASRVAALIKGKLERPSDFDGVVYISLDNGSWELPLARELKAAGLSIDLNRVLD